jgi:large subunit ribosomal protein L25
MAEITLNVETRTGAGTQFVKKMRRDGQVPGVYYFHGKQNIPFFLERQSLRAVWGHESTLLDVVFDGNEHKKCVIREIQFDPISGRPIHVDLMGVKMTEKLKVSVHVLLTGVPEGVKVGGGTLQQIMREVEVECLPADLPEAIELDVTNLNIGDSLSISNIQIEKVAVLGDPDTVLVTIAAPRVEVEPEVEAPVSDASAQPEVITRKAKEDEEE